MRGAVAHAGVTAGPSRPATPGRRMIDHDGNPAARQAGYPVGEERDPDPPALEQGAGRDLTRPPDPAAAATAPRGSPGGRWPDGGLPPSKRTGRFGSPAISGSLCYRGRSHAHLPPEDHNTLQSTALARLSSRLSGATQMHRQGAPHRPIGGMSGCYAAEPNSGICVRSWGVD